MSTRYEKRAPYFWIHWIEKNRSLAVLVSVCSIRALLSRLLFGDLFFENPPRFGRDEVLEVEVFELLLVGFREDDKTRRALGCQGPQFNCFTLRTDVDGDD